MGAVVVYETANYCHTNCRKKGSIRCDIKDISEMTRYSIRAASSHIGYRGSIRLNLEMTSLLVDRRGAIDDVDSLIGYTITHNTPHCTTLALQLIIFC